MYPIYACTSNCLFICVPRSGLTLACFIAWVMLSIPVSAQVLTNTKQLSRQYPDSAYKTGPKTGYLLVSDQGANQFHIFRREGESGNPNDYKLLKVVKVTAQVSDGSDVTNVPLGKQFPHGLFVTMSEGKTFHYYRWEDIAGKELK